MLGDAIAQSLIVRDKNNTTYQQILESLCQDGLDGRETAPFQQGLYGCSEMFVNGFIRLIDAELIRRPVYPDLALQRLANEGRVGPRPSVSVLQDLLAAGRIQAVLTAADLVYLQGLGLLRPGIALQGGALQFEGKSYPSDLHQAGDWTALLGARWMCTRSISLVLVSRCVVSWEARASTRSSSVASAGVSALRANR